MSSTRVAIELLYDRIDVAVLRGARAVAGGRVPIALVSDAAAWVKAVRRSGEALRAVVEELGVAGASAAVVYYSPTQAVDLVGFQLRSKAQAREAALLSSDEMVHAVNTSVCEAVAVGQDRSGPNRQMHVVVAVERNDVAGAIVEMVETAGLKFLSATPIDAAMIAALVDRALGYAGPLHGWLHFGEQSSYFLVGGRGAVRFGRSISLGLATIAQSLTRPIPLPGTDEPLELDYGTAKRILHQHGIPDADQIVHEEPQLTRRHIMPLIQPVLQRYIIELRQSLRFGLSEGGRGSIEITVSGPGSAVPRFAELLTKELGLQVTADPHDAEYDHRVPAALGSELLHAIGAGRFLSRLNLQPRELARRRQAGRLRRWLWTGAAAALAVVVADGVRFEARLGDARQEDAALATATAGLETLHHTQTRLLAAVRAMDALEGTIADEVGARVNVRAILQEFSRLTPESIRLTSIQLHHEKGAMLAAVGGHAQSSVATAPTELEVFVAGLKSSPLFDDVGLRSIQLATLGGTSGQRFEVGLVVVRAPAPGEGELRRTATAERGTER